MRNLGEFSLLFFLFLGGALGDDVAAPMEESERKALYTAIQGFVGNDWNGSDLYPDPCGWTPIQGVSCDLFGGKWYVTTMSIGPTLENSLQCAPIAQFSSPLFELKRLQSLTFFNCFPRRRSTAVPAAVIPGQPWVNLAGSLETLEFRSNSGLVGPLPPSFAALRRLRSLVIVENGLSGELPTAISGLPSLQRLVISGNNFSGPIPTVNSSNLLILDLSRNSLTGRIPGSLGRLNGLLKLDLSCNLLSGPITKELGEMTNLTLLDLRKNNFSSGIPDSLSSMLSLQELLLSENPLGGQISNFPWESMKKLKTVDLSDTGLWGPLPIALANLSELRSLHLNNNNLSGVVNFPEEFIVRLGRGLSVTGNPNLCSLRVNGPVGLRVCKNGEPVKEVPGAGERVSSDAASLALGFLSLCWVMLFW